METCRGHSIDVSLVVVLPPANHKIPFRWPPGEDVIWHANVNITAQEVLYSGNLTKRVG